MELFEVWNSTDGWLVMSYFGNAVFYGSERDCRVRCRELNDNPPDGRAVRLLEDAALTEIEIRHGLRNEPD